jgi:hypothetical protein
MQADTPPPE